MRGGKCVEAGKRAVVIEKIFRSSIVSYDGERIVGWSTGWFGIDRILNETAGYQRQNMTFCALFGQIQKHILWRSTLLIPIDFGAMRVLKNTSTNTLSTQ